MKCIEFEHLKQLEDKSNPFTNLYELESGDRFYIEPVFYTQLKGFKDYQGERYDEIINKIIDLVKQNHRVVFTGNYDCPLTNVDGYIYLEITDVTDPLRIFAEDKSRGSDYGD